jgi:hypothetical protein
MKDRLSKERRSWNMSRIRGKDTTPEKIVRSLLHRLGYRFRLHRRIPIEGRAKLPLRPGTAAQQRRPTVREGSGGTSSARSHFGTHEFCLILFILSNHPTPKGNTRRALEQAVLAMERKSAARTDGVAARSRP